MKKMINTVAVVAFVLTAALFVSCKDKEVTANDEILTPADTAMAVEPDTTATAPVNDSNVSGVTSGKMEQVP